MIAKITSRGCKSVKSIEDTRDSHSGCRARHTLSVFDHSVNRWGRRQWLPPWAPPFCDLPEHLWNGRTVTLCDKPLASQGGEDLRHPPGRTMDSPCQLVYADVFGWGCQESYRHIEARSAQSTHHPWRRHDRRRHVGVDEDARYLHLQVISTVQPCNLCTAQLFPREFGHSIGHDNHRVVGRPATSTAPFSSSRQSTPDSTSASLSAEMAPAPFSTRGTTNRECRCFGHRRQHLKNA